MTARWLRPLQSEAWLAQARERLAADEVVPLNGLLGPARLLVPLLLTDAPLLVVVPRERDVEAVVDDLRTLAHECGRSQVVLPFPAPGPSPFRGLPRNPDAALQRATALHAARRGRAVAVVASSAGLLRPTLAAELFETRAFVVRVGEEMTPEILMEALEDCGYRHEDPVGRAGERARRGGIVDLFPPDRSTPVRIEFFGDQIETLRGFDPDTQRSQESLSEIEIVPLSDAFAPRSLIQKLVPALRARFSEHRELDGLLERIERGFSPELLPELLPLVSGATMPPVLAFRGFVPVLLDPEAVAREAEALRGRAAEDRTAHEGGLLPEVDEAFLDDVALLERLSAAPSLQLREIDLEPERSQNVVCRPVRRYAGDIPALSGDLRSGPRTIVFLGNSGRAERLSDRLHEDGHSLGEEAGAEIRVGALSAGFELPPLRVLADGDVFPEEVHVHRSRRGAKSFLSDFRDLRIGDLVVHQDHGIGRFEGLETISIGEARREFMVLSYQGGDKLKVPIEAFDRIQKYASAEGARPLVDRLGSGQWDKVKKRVKKAMRDMAQELLRLFAERKARPGHSFSLDSPWLREFEASFEFEETPDQGAAIAEVAYDMARPTPMDRLICGDVGYGKTEVAMRAAMQAVLDAKQVAVPEPKKH